MYSMKLSEYPNGEIRITTAKMRSPVNPLSQVESLETNDEIPPLTLGENSKRVSRNESDDPKPGYGGLPRSKVFSLRGRRTLLRAGGVFSHDGMQQQDVLFLTGTLPGSTPEAFETIARWSGYLVNALKAWIAKRVKNKFDFYVWEHQKRGALHLHYAVYCPDKCISEYILAEFPNEWVRLLLNVVVKSGIDLFDTGRGYSWMPEVAKNGAVAQRVVKSVGAYLAKYAGKGAGAVTRNVAGIFHSPSQWYGVSRPLLARLRELTVERMYYAVRQGEIAKAFNKLHGYLANLADVCHNYFSEVINLPQLVAYNSHWNLETLWLRTMENHKIKTQASEKSSKSLEWTNSYLITVAKRYMLSPEYLSRNSSQMSALSLEKLYGCQALSIAEVMDLIHALRWNSWWKFKDRNQNGLLQKDLEMLDNLYCRILTLRIQSGYHPSEPFMKICEYGVDKTAV